MYDILSVGSAVLLFVGLIWLALQIEPHWVSKNGRRMIARVQPLGSRNEPEGRWREMRVLVDGSTVILSTRGLGSLGLRGEYQVQGKSPEPPRRRAIYILSGQRQLLLRIPSNSRAIPVLDSLVD